MDERGRKTGRWLRFTAMAAAAAMSLTAAVAFAEAETLAEAEAEDGLLLGGAKVSWDGARVENIRAVGDGVTVTIEAPETGFYDIVVRASSADGGSKTNYVDVDGERMGEIVTTGRSAQDSVLRRVYMEAGAHEVSVIGYWCWITVDKVSLRRSEELPADLFDVEPVLVNPNATDNARRLMHYLTDCYGKAILSGQYCDQGAYGHENRCIWSATGGEYPAVLGLDMIEYSPSRAAHHDEALKTTDLAIQYWEAGGIITYCWHWNLPEKYLKGEWWDGFYQEKVSINLPKIMSGGDPEGYELLMADIDAIAVELKKLQDAGVPVLWRPLHEASGGWFWWGAFGPEPYLELYRTLYDRLVNVHGLNNLIWIWNGQDAAWYPGDEYVDIIGDDIYAGEHVYSSQAERFLRAMACTDARKMIVLSENGTIPDPELLFRDGVPWGFFCTWGGEFVAKSSVFNVLSEQYTEKSMVQKVYSSDLVITRSELPDLKSYPLPGEP